MVAHKKSRIPQLLSKINPEVLFGRKQRPREPRTVYFNQPLPQEYYDHKGKVLKNHTYITNQVVTSKYTVFTFVPRNLLEQFRRVANIFFAGIAILQFFPRFSTISPGLVLLPLIAVLLISAIKDGYEDIKRHQSDRAVNHSIVHVLEAPDWVNPNATGKKSKTFVRAIFRKKAKGSVEGDVEAPASGEPNSQPSLVDEEAGAKEPRWKPTIWEDLRVGDFVKLHDNEPVPADIVICATSEDENVAYVETKNLDGETNLKSRNAIPSLTHLRTAEACADANLASFTVESDSPQENMYKLNAKVQLADSSVKPSPVEIQTVLLRGTVIRHTEWVIGVVLFTGEDSKVVMNSSGAPSKRSKVEKQMNPQVGINLGLLFVMAVVCAIAESAITRQNYRDNAPWVINPGFNIDGRFVSGLTTWANALITFQNVVPISLYVSLEFVRALQAAFIFFDHDIYYDKTDKPTAARSWNLADDLGQIEYVFSDKTGTLTQNAMVFRQCSIGGKVYSGSSGEEPKTSDSRAAVPTSSAASSGESGSATAVPSTANAETPIKLPQGVLQRFYDKTLQADLAAAQGAEAKTQAANQARTLNGFFTVLSLCHTAIAALDQETGAIEYKAQSPDEAALVQAAADSGFIFCGKDKEIFKIRTPFVDHVEEYELLNLLEFNSTRKRMSVIVRKLDEGDDRIFLLCKGADNVIFERLRPGQDNLRQTTEDHLESFANEGLRTLCLAYKVVEPDHYDAWNSKYQEASVALKDRDKQMEELMNDIEGDLRLLGATAIEDRLQDGVPQTIADLKRAGIKVWVATGDKLETAIAIGYSTNMIASDSNLIIVRGGKHPVDSQLKRAAVRFFGDSEVNEKAQTQSMERTRTRDSQSLYRVTTGASSIAGEGNGSRPGGFVLVIDGAALDDALKEEHKDLLLHVSTRCEAVICCRTSPLQKAQIVRLVKEGLGAMTLAIGDGANDVSMIQAAHVGVGISGEEGLQAVNASDYAIAQFRFLKRLVLVHGHWSYARNGNMIVNFFYKNIVCIGVLWWYQIYCAWSTQYVFDYTYLLFWNVFWSLATVVAIGIFDRIIDDDVLMALPELYRPGREGKWFGLGIFALYMIDAVYQSAVIFFLTTYSYQSISGRSDGYSVDNVESSTTMVMISVMVVNAFNGLNTSAWTGWVFFAVTIGPILVWLFTIIYSAVSPGWFITKVYGNNHFLFRSPIFWFTMLLLPVICLLPRYIAKATKILYNPSDIEILRAARKYNPDLDVWNHPLLGGRGHGSGLPEEKDEVGDMNQFPPRPSFQSRRSLGSRTDMATGLSEVHRGFDFSTEEDGVSMRRIQSNLSGKHASRTSVNAAGLKKNNSSSLFPSLRRSMRKRPKYSPENTSVPS